MTDGTTPQEETATWPCGGCRRAGAIQPRSGLTARPVGSYSLAGRQMKFSAYGGWVYACQPDLGGCGRPVEDVRLLAYMLHAGQRDKQDRPYVEHLAAVEAAVKDRGGSVVQRIAALLHDCVEDGRATPDQLAAAGVPPDALTLIDALTHRPGEPRPDYIARVLAVPAAVPVKEADLDHNQGRIAGITDPAVRDRLDRKYARDREQIAQWRARGGA